MANYLETIPGIREFFPPTPRAAELLLNAYRLFPIVCLLEWTPLRNAMAWGKTSVISKFNVSGRLGWAISESIGPLNLLYILYTLPSKIRPIPNYSTSFLGTGLPAQCEIMALLYILHYFNRAFLTPLFLAPSMSPMHVFIPILMAIHQFVNSSNLACWLVYSTIDGNPGASGLLSPISVVGLMIFLRGLYGNFASQNQLFQLRRAAARRKAKSEGKAVISYDKVYVIPQPEGWFKTSLYPHYAMEWLEWVGYWIIGAGWDLGWGYQSAALWFAIGTISTTCPRAVHGKQWYQEKFGKKAVAGRAAVLAWLNL